MSFSPTVYVIDDDIAVRNFLTWMMESARLSVLAFESAHDFLRYDGADRPGCILLDIRMPGMSGLELQKWLHAHETDLPVIMITGHGDVPLAVEAMKAGAFDFFEKPFDTKGLLARIQEALTVSVERVQHRKNEADILDRIHRLTQRERDVYDLLVLGDTNKAIAKQLGISVKTVEIHRSRVMIKMEVRTASDLIKGSRRI